MQAASASAGCRTSRLLGKPNAGGFYKVDRYDAERDLAWVHRPKDGWKCCAHGPALYDVPGRGIELQWNYSTGGQFSADDCGEGW